MRDTIRFVRRGRIVVIGDFDPMALLIAHLRLTEGAKGTKEGCGEGRGAAASAMYSTRRRPPGRAPCR